MKIEMHYGVFKQWKDIYNRDVITEQLWRSIEENQDLERKIENKNTDICYLEEEVYRLKAKIKRMKEKK